MIIARKLGGSKIKLGVYLAQALILFSASLAEANDKVEKAAEKKVASPVNNGTNWLAPEPLLIRLVEKRADIAEQAAKQRKAWPSACKAIGIALSVSQGPWGSGLFSKYSCELVDATGKKVTATPSAGGPNPAPSPAPQAPWVLEIIDNGEQTAFVLNRARPAIELARASLPATEWNVEILSDGEFADLLAMVLLDQAPATTVFGKPFTKPTEKGIVNLRMPSTGEARERKFVLPDATKKFSIYRLRYNSIRGAWTSEIIGSAEYKDNEEISYSKQAKTKKHNNERIVGRGAWEFDKDALAALAKEPKSRFYAHNFEGPESQSVKLKAQLLDAHQKMVSIAREGGLGKFLLGGYDFLKNVIADTVATGYVGMRMGKQVIPGDPLLTKAVSVGVLGEVRGGPLEGLRVYYDYLPKITADDNGFATSIAWSRLIFGASFGFSPGWLIDRIDITPKIGMWSLVGDLAVRDPETDAVTGTEEFDFKQKFSLGLEAGVEWPRDDFLVRGWYGFDTALSFGKYGGSNVKSNRLGVDTYWKAGPTFPIFGVPFKTAILAFYFYETVDLAKPEVKQEQDELIAAGDTSANSPLVDGLTIIGGYLGLGLAISW